MQDKLNKNTEISERISKLLDFLGVNANEFAKKLGYDRSQTVYDVLNGKSAPSFDFFNRLLISEYSVKINVRWLLTGKGDIKPGNQDTSEIGRSEVLNKPKGFPLVTQTAIGGFGSSSFSIQEQDVKAYYVIPKFHHKQIDFMIEVEGSSMYPKYNSGDVVACRIIKKDGFHKKDDGFIQWNKAHVVGTLEQGIIIKRIKKGSSENTLMMVSDNKNYDPFEVPKDEITGMALVVGVIRLE